MKAPNNQQDSSAEIIQPPRDLKRKVPRTGGPDPQEAILRALGAAEVLMDEYQGWAVDELDALWRSFKEARPGVSDADKVQDMFDKSHEIRGHGGSFKFPVISSIGDSLCKLLEGHSRLNTAQLEAVKVHILAMKAVFRQQIKGDGGEVGRAIPELLALLRKRVTPAR